MAGKKPKSVGTAIGAAVVGFEHAVFRTTPPAHEVVVHARHDDPVPTGDGRFVIISVPGLDLPPPASEIDAESDTSGGTPPDEAP